MYLLTGHVNERNHPEMGSSTNTDGMNAFNEEKDFTRKAAKSINTVINAEDFRDQSAEMIYEYLLRQKSYVTFCDHLKRYLYEHNQFNKPYGDVTINEYAQSILSSFKANNAPLAFQPTTRKPMATVKKWLAQSSASRSVVFLLGFGLKMTVREVDSFLKKAISESTFNMIDYEEVIYQYCFYNQLPYSKAVSLLEYYQSKEFPAAKAHSANKFRIGKMTSDEELIRYLQFLKTQVRYELKNNKAYDCYDLLLGRVRSLIASERRFTNNAHVVAEISENTKGLATSAVSSQMVEEMIYSGISYTEDMNLQSMGDSSLKDVFGRYRLTRPRISSLQKRKIKVERYDLITLLFVIYANEHNAEDYDASSGSSPKELCMRFTEEANNMLTQCGMIHLYPVNPYESFILLCLLSDDPWESFCETWYQSYHSQSE